MPLQHKRYCDWCQELWAGFGDRNGSWSQINKIIQKFQKTPELILSFTNFYEAAPKIQKKNKPALENIYGMVLRHLASLNGAISLVAKVSAWLAMAHNTSSYSVYPQLSFCV
jgi:hypothetical protein